MGLQKKDGSRHAIGALAVIVSAPPAHSAYICVNIFISSLFTICYASVISQLMLQIP